jgi:hypothetical protein
VRTISTFFAFALLVALAAAAAAQSPSDVPSKKIRIFNNTSGPIYVFIQSPARLKELNTSDLWMQAQFKIDDWDSNFRTQRTFNTSRLYRAYFEVGEKSGGSEPSSGIAPNQSIEITVPFYTQLKSADSDNLGKVDDQFVDWWNAVRVYLLDSEAAYHSAKVTNNPGEVPGGGLPQPIVKPLDTAALPTCTSSDNRKCSVLLREVAINIPFSIPFELQEYTFASAEGPPLNRTLPPPTRTKIDISYVNYNVSSLDSVFLPVAIGPVNNKNVPYVGTTMSVDKFRQALNSFSASGDRWPFYVPAYFDDKKRSGFPSTMSLACSLRPWSSANAYKLPSIPGTRFLLEESYKGYRGSGFPPVPPVMSSNPANWQSVYLSGGKAACIPPQTPPFVDPPALGAFGKQMVGLWKRCTESTNATLTCNQIRRVEAVFKQSYQKNCAGKGNPSWIAVMTAVYGWTPVSYDGCAGADLASIPGFADAQKDYCSLQYNYLTLSSGEFTDYVFNRYTRLVHGLSSIGGLESSSYAFSIDDKLSFKSVKADGLIIAVGGAKGLENQTPTPLPTKGTIFDHCKAP